ncbi:uncharacterized protein LOC142564865 isoform X5 [Dermacentor variabilis]|uniref:uncharacterized protein LOC142564865 isoform X5 n=1 Tax=Dermacentor variabilis TaxID=34621 RepID=UPI003F5C6192
MWAKKKSTAVMHICKALSFLIFVELCDSSRPKTHDDRCKIILNATSSECPRQRWFFNWKNKVCLPSCSATAPFTSKIECQGICRSGDVCDFPVASALCFNHVFPVYVYSPKEESCFLTYDCTYFLNKFPTLGECLRTCVQRNTQSTNPATNIQPPLLLGKRNSVSSMPPTKSKMNTRKKLPMTQFPTGKQDIKTPGVSNAQGTGQPSYFDILLGQQDPTAPMLPILKIQIRHTPSTRDMRCRMHVADTSLNKCHHKRWYYNEIKRVCQRTCSEEAPFLNKMDCDGVCRTVDVCGFPVASFPCFREVHPVFIYNPNDESCFKSYGCSYFGNKFPTLEECRRTCKKCAANDQSGSLTASSSQGNGQILSFASSAGNQIPPSSSGLSTGMALANDRCQITPQTSKNKCSHQRWYLDQKTKRCLQSCDPAAPFSNKIQCEGVCRNGKVCDYPMASVICFGEVFPVYIYNPNKGRCFFAYDCSYFGNKFPTLGECQRTCGKRTGSRLLPGRTDNLVPQVTLQSTTAAGSGLVAQQTGIGEQQSEGTTATGTHVAGSAANFSQSAGVGQATTLQSQSSLGTGSGVTQTTNVVQGSTIPATSSSQVSSQTNIVNATLPNQLPLLPPKNPPIVQVTMQQIATEQQEVTFSSGINQQACTPPCMFNTSVPQQGNLQANLTAVKIHEKPKRPKTDKRCKVIATIPTYKCRERWFFNKKTGVCLPSCSRRAPFRNKIACDGVCRSAEACNFPMASIPCFRQVHEVFIYNPNQNSCFKAYDCSYFGNKFPTMPECQRTCRKGGSQQHLAGSATGTSLLSTQIQNAGSTVGLQPASSNSAASLGAGILGSGTGTGGPQQHLAGSATGTSLLSTQIQNTGSTVGLQPASSNSAASLGAGLLGNGIGTGGSQQHLAGSATGTSVPPTLIQNTGSTAGLQPASSNSAASVGAGLLGNGIGTGGSQQHLAGSATGTSVPPTLAQNTGSTAGLQTASSNSAASVGAGLLGNGMGTGAGQDGSRSTMLTGGQATGVATSFHASAGQQAGPSVPVKPNNQGRVMPTPGTGGAEQQVGIENASISQVSGQTSSSDTTASHQAGPSLSGMSTGSGLSGHQPPTGSTQGSGSSLLLAQQHSQTGPVLTAQQAAEGAAQQQIANVTASSVLAMGPAPNSGSSAGDLPAPSLSATSTGTSLVEHPLGTAQVSASSSLSSAQVNGSPAGLLTPQVGVTGAGAVAGQITIGSTQGSVNHAGSGVQGSGLRNNSNAPGIEKPGSFEPIKPSGPGYGARQPGEGQNESTGSGASGQTTTVTQQHHQSDKKLSLKDAYDHRCKNTYGWGSANCTTERWYYNRRTRECRPSCNPAAPFLAKIDCDGICRSAEACDFPMASIFCLRPKHVIYIYNPNKRRCFQAHDCSYFGNKFPTLGECRRTCIKSSAQKPLPSSTGSISQSPGQASTSGSHRGQQSTLSQSGAFTGAGLLVNVQGTGLPKPLPAPAESIISHPGSQNPKASAVTSNGISSEDQATVNAKSIKK